MTNIPQRFYEQAYQSHTYARAESATSHSFYAPLRDFLARYNLDEKHCLEVGTGRGAFQNLVRDYVGIDIAASAGQYVKAPFAAASATALPFCDESFDAIWTITVLEHVPSPERALAEIWRVLKPGGYLFLAPAWQCRPWAAQGYPVRPYSDFDWKGKLVKASIPVRNSVLCRILKIFPQRLSRLLIHQINHSPTRFRYGELNANFDYFWMSDSDAVNSMDPFEAYIWYVSRGALCLNYASLTAALLIRTGPLIFQKPKTVWCQSRQQ
jgi:SAM-dependent methyltransferase